MRFHVLAVPHTITNKDFVACAFTQKVFKFCDMMTHRGHTVIHYGHEDSDVMCTEHVTVIDRETYNRVYGNYDWKTQNFKFDLLDEAYQTYNANAIREIRNRQQPNDFVLAFWGQGNKAICDQLSDMRIVEPGIGYSQAFAPFRVYESYALMHANFGLERVQTSGNMPWYHVVIPNYFDPKDFEFSETKQDYFLYLGRITTAKGVDLAINVTAHIGAKLVIAGQGGPGDLGLDEWPSHVEYVGYAFADKRRELMKNAKGVFIFSTYVEPFAGTMIESFFSGTPVISTDWGTFAENNLHAVTGYRCRTFDHMVWAAQNIDQIDPHACRAWAQNFTLERVSSMYEDYFKSIITGWYSIDTHRTHINSLTRNYPSVIASSIDAIFPCFEQTYAADKALESYRRCYPSSRVVMMCDGGDPSMQQVAEKYNAEYTHFDRIGICHWKNPTEWVERFFGAVEKMTTEFFVMQEEDVFHVRPVKMRKLVYDICGTNPDAKFPTELVDYIHCETGRTCTHYSASGGCFFRTSFFKELANTDWRRHMDHVPHQWLWADVAISFLTCLYGGTIGYCSECVELGRPEYETQKDPAVIHQYKVHYKQPQKILWVTAFKDFGRSSWSVSQRPEHWYFEQFERIRHLDPVCFTDDPRVMCDRKYPFDESDTFFGKKDLYHRHMNILNSSAFWEKCPPGRKYAAPEYTYPEYSLICFSKTSFLRRASDMFPGYTHYAWIDFGFAKKSEACIPSYQDVPRDQVYISSCRMLTFSSENETIYGEPGSTDLQQANTEHNWNNPQLIVKHQHWIVQANSYLVPRHMTHWLEKQMEYAVERHYELGIVGHDEPIFHSIIHDFPKRFKINIKTDWTGTW